MSVGGYLLREFSVLWVEFREVFVESGKRNVFGTSYHVQIIKVGVKTLIFLMERYTGALTGHGVTEPA